VLDNLRENNSYETVILKTCILSCKPAYSHAENTLDATLSGLLQIYWVDKMSNKFDVTSKALSIKRKRE